MSADYRDLFIIKKVIRYYDEADETRTRFGNSIDSLKADRIYKNAAAMCVLQIGELIGHLSEDFTAQYNGMPWRQIKGMRNIAAHGYENFDLDILWLTLVEDLPSLKIYCEEIIRNES